MIFITGSGFFHLSVLSRVKTLKHSQSYAVTSVASVVSLLLCLHGTTESNWGDVFD